MDQKAAQPRVSFPSVAEDGQITIKRGDENLTLPVSGLLQDQELMARFAVLGLVAHLRKVSADLPSEDRMAAIEREYDRIEEQGVKALDAKQTRNRGPRKAEKIAALAVLESATTDAIEEALSQMSKDHQDEVLNSDRVTEQLGRMKRTGFDLAA